MAKFLQDIGGSLSSFTAAVDDSPGKLVATGPTLITGFNIKNNVAAVSYIQCFNAAALSDVNLGTTVPDYVIPVPTSGQVVLALTFPLYFSLGLCVFSTTTSTGSTGASQDVSMLYA